MQNVRAYVVLKSDEVLTFNLHCANFQSHKMVFETRKTQFFNIPTVIIFFYKQGKKYLFSWEYVEQNKENFNVLRVFLSSLVTFL